MLSVSQSADILGITPSRVRALIKNGSLNASKIGRVWLLEEKDVLQRVSENPKAGRPKTKAKSHHRISEQEAPALEAVCADGHALYLSCKEYFRFRPSGDIIRQAESAEEASFYMAVADFFLQQRQAQLVAEGVY